MKRTRTASWLWGLAAVFGVLVASPRSHVCGQDLAVVESSTQDHASAEKLGELIHEPFTRVGPEASSVSGGACRSRARLELVLDSEQHSVRLIRCADGTVLARVLDPEASRQTPYLGAFVAAELLVINRELEAVEARVAAPAPSAPEVSRVRVDQAPGGPEPSAPAGAARPISFRVRAGAELALWGAPFDHAVRPSFGLGLLLPGPSRDSAWYLEACVGLWATAELTRASQQLRLTRHDGQLRAGLVYSLGALQLAGFVLGRASLAKAQYLADTPLSEVRLHTGLGVGADAQVSLFSGFGLYAQLALDVATIRGDYRVSKESWGTDPVSLLWVALGVGATF